MASIDLGHVLLHDLLQGDLSGAIETVSDMNPNEREKLRRAALEIMKLTDPDLWCRGCNKFIDDDPMLAKFYDAAGRWHHRCQMRVLNNHSLV